MISTGSPGRAALAATPPASAPRAAAAQANVKYWRGAVMNPAAVALLYWGSWWNKNDDHQAQVKSYLKDYFSGIVTPGDRWSRIISQYKGLDGRPTIGFGQGVYDSRLVWTDPATPPREATFDQVEAEAAKYATRLRRLGFESEIFIYVMSPSWAHPEGFHDIPAADDFCGRHEAAWFQPSAGDDEAFSYVNLPWVYGDKNCYADAVPAAPDGALQGFSINAGHEFAEAMSDPYWQLTYRKAPSGSSGPYFGWAGQVNGKPSASEEIGDKCGSSSDPKYQPFFAEKLPTGVFAQEKIWSNQASGCVQAAAKDAPPLYG